MISRSSFLVDCTEGEVLRAELINLVGGFDIEFSISNFDYFSVAEYREYVGKNQFPVNDNPDVLAVMAEVEFLHEVCFHAGSQSVASQYLPALTGLVAQMLSKRLGCNAISSFVPLASSEDFPVSYFSRGKEVRVFSRLDADAWQRVEWVRVDRD